MFQTIGWWLCFFIWVFGILSGIVLTRFAARFVRVVIMRKPGKPYSFILWRNAFARWTLIVLSAFFYFLLIDAYWIEPGWIKIRTTEIKSAKILQETGKIRIIHISDLHIENEGSRELKVPDMINALDPDFIMITGDFINAESGREPLIRFLEKLKPRQKNGVYVVLGNSDNPTHGFDEKVLKVEGVTLLDRRIVTRNVRGSLIDICGVRWGSAYNYERVRDRISKHIFSVLLYHSVSARFFEDIARDGFDLTLAGDSHGGQVYIPFIGSAERLAGIDRKYVDGLYTLPRLKKMGGGESYLYVNRGLGMGGGSMPRVRLFCRPEIAVIDIIPGQD